MEDRIKAINQRLKSAKVPISLRLKGSSLYLRSTKFPPREGDRSGKQYELAQGKASLTNIARCEREAHRLWGLILNDRFEWEDSGDKKQRSTEEWIERFKKHYLETHPDCTERTFSRFWLSVLDKLPQDTPPSSEGILIAVLATDGNTWTRRQTCQKLLAFSKYIGLDVDLTPYQGSYGRGSVAPRNLPSDEQIEAWHLSIPMEPWRIIFNRLAVFGLRPSESFFFELIDTHTARVIDAKSGLSREVKAFHPHWAEQWQFEGSLPKISWGSKKKSKAQQISQRIAVQLKRYGIKCERYDLRHAWCVRIIIHYPKIPVSISARWAGHSPAVHQSTYERWISKAQQDQVYKGMVLGE